MLKPFDWHYSDIEKELRPGFVCDNLDEIIIIGIRTRGEYLAQRLIKLINDTSGRMVDSGTLDVTFYRDDFRTNLGSPKIGSSNILCKIEDRTVILIDDVLYTGRTVRAAIDVLLSFGRPRKIQLGVLVDRGHREMPIRADFVGKNIPTSLDESVQVRLMEIDGMDEVTVEREDSS